MIGWRWWRIAGDRLQSLSCPVLWEGPTLRADKKPTSVNPHGIYALTEKSEIGPYCPSAATLRTFGEVELSETVVRAERGLRGEVATIRSLHIRRPVWVLLDCDGLRHREYGERPSKELLASLETRYQVEVTLVDEEPEGHQWQDYLRQQQQMLMQQQMMFGPQQMRHQFYGQWP